MMIAAFKTNAARARPTTARELRSDPANQDLHQRIEAWASSRGIRDEWLMDAAVQTLAALARGSEAGRWVYIAPELPLPRFEPRFEAVWIPAAKWNDFRKHLVRQFEASLKEYRKAMPQSGARMADPSIRTRFGHCGFSRDIAPIRSVFEASSVCTFA